MLLVLILASAATVMYLVPARFLDASDGVPNEHRVLVNKISRFFDSGENPDIIVLGSSIMLIPAARCDDRMDGQSDCYAEWYYYQHFPDYDQSKYLERQLSEKLAQPFKLKNLAIASSIMSDHCGVLEEVVARDRHPKLVICGLAPRDFLDNTFQNWQQTPTRMYLNETRAIAGLPSEFSVPALVDWYKCSERHFKKVFARIRTACSNIACNLTSHPVKLAYVRDEIKQVKPNFQKDVRKYNDLYNPPNFPMLAIQAEHLTKMLTLARANNIQVVLVNMPLARENIACLNKDAYRTYLETLHKTARDHDVVLLDLASLPEYSREDFEDSCHLDAEGGFKLYRQIVSGITTNSALTAKLLKPRNDSIAGTRKTY